MSDYEGLQPASQQPLAPQQDWLRPDAPLSAPTSAVDSHLPGIQPPPRPVLRYDIRPLSTGEVLDRTFTLFRARFWLFAGLSSIASAISVPISIAQRALQRLPVPGAGLGAFTQSGPYWAITIVGGVLAFLAYSITNAATVSAVSAVYLGHETSIPIALRSIQRHWFRYPLIGLWQAWSFLWVPLVLIIPAAVLIGIGGGLAALGILLIFLSFAGGIYGIIAILRNSLAVPAAVIEDSPVRGSMRRSKYLTAGGKGRIFLLGLLLWALYLVAGVVQIPFAMVIAQSRATEHLLAQAVVFLVTFLTGALVGPIGAIALCLFYIDERVRKEAFDIDVLMSRSAPPIPPTENPELA